MQSFLIFFIKFAIVSFAVAAMIMYLLNFIKMWIEKERKSWDASGHSPECEYDIEYFETMFKDHDIPLDGTRWKVPEGFRINVSLNNGIVVKIYPGDEISAREDSLAVYRKVYRKVETNSGLFEHINTYCDWDGINSIQAVSPFKTASELLDGDDEYVMNELYEARAVYRALTKEANKCPKCQGRGWYLMGGNDYSKTCECQQQEATDE